MQQKGCFFGCSVDAMRCSAFVLLYFRCSSVVAAAAAAAMKWSTSKSDLLNPESSNFEKRTREQEHTCEEPLEQSR